MGGRIVVSIAVLGFIASPGLRAQDAEHSKITTNLGAGVNAFLNPTARLVHPSANIVVGAGYNFNKHHSVLGQFMWAGLNENRDALRPIRLLTGIRDLDGSSNLYTITANYRLRKEGKTYGAYFIAGGGAYIRHTRLSRDVVVGAGTVCGPWWNWWGFGCVSGFVTDDVTLVSETSTAFGGNGGIGFTVKIHEDGYKFYVEARYHYAPTSRIATTLIPITVGFSW